jgi:cobalt/nickel transport system permease protein
MHIPDGLLDARTGAISAMLAASGVGLALSRVRRTLPPERIPLMGLAAAFVFAAQMVNFPVAGGTSGHLMGGALVSVLVGPSAAVIVLTSVLIVQCLVFADGGVLALGANVFNMALVGTLMGGLIHRATSKVLPGPRGLITSASFAGWCSIVAASLSCAGQLACSGVAPWRAVFPAMTGIHMLIGLGEGFITGLVVAGLLRMRPDLFSREQSVGTEGRYRIILAYGLVLLTGLGLFLAPFACPWPDGLEHVADRLGFTQRALESTGLHAPLAEYTLPGLENRWNATLLAGGVGATLAFLMSLFLGRFLMRYPPPTPPRP